MSSRTRVMKPTFMQREREWRKKRTNDYGRENLRSYSNRSLVVTDAAHTTYRVFPL